MGEQIPFPGGGQQQQMRVNLEDLTDLVCDECGDQYFRQVMMIKRLSPIVSPSGKEQFIPMPIFRCDACGHVNDVFIPRSTEQ